jgi:hypothetical protein
MTPNPDFNRSAKQGILSAEIIPMFSGRPVREKIIGRDDLLDLDILLHTCDSVEAFLAKL